MSSTPGIFRFYAPPTNLRYWDGDTWTGARMQRSARGRFNRGLRPQRGTPPTGLGQARQRQDRRTQTPGVEDQQEGDRQVPPYVVHWTDYSSTRKAPLAREVRLAPTEEQAIAIAEQMIVENVKKGWELVN